MNEFFASKGWIIQDWAGNNIFPDKTFATFAEGCAFADEKFTTDDDRGEVCVIEVLEKVEKPGVEEEVEFHVLEVVA